MDTPLTLTQFVKRPAFGKVGQQVSVRSNFFEITEFKNVTVHHYDVSITPQVPPPVCRRLYEQFLQVFGNADLGGARPVFDGRKNLFSPKELPFQTRTFEVTLASDVQSGSRRPPPVFKVKIRKVAVINLEELQRFIERKSGLTNNILSCIMALDIVIRHKPALLHETIGRSFFTPEGKQLLSGPLEVWRGFYQSARPSIGRMMINLDLSATAFFQSGSLLEMVLKILGLRHTDDLRRTTPPINWQKVEKTIRGLRITTRHRAQSSRALKISKLTPNSASVTTFKLTVQKNGDDAPSEVETTVENYFKDTYSIRLQFPMLPCVVAGKMAMLPLELCSVVEGQRCPKKLDERQTADMIKFTCQPPHVRANIIKQGLQILSYDNNEYLKDFGIKVSPEMVTIKGRVLPAPTVQYHPSSRDASFTPRDGAWNLMGKKVASGTVLGSWGVVVFGSERDVPTTKVASFLRELIVVCIDTGMTILNKEPPISYQNPHSPIEQGLRQAWLRAGNAVKSQPQLLVCVLPNTGTPLYAEIKRITDTVIGISSQCVQVKHVHNPKKQYCANVCLKMNVKLGGMNSQLGPTMLPVLTAKPTIIFGADVSHPAPGDSVRPSIAALVGSMDSKAARYAASVRVQTARTESIADLSSMTIDLLKTFYQTCGHKPERIVFFRDGVSEGQFADVLKNEVAAVKAGCRTLEADYDPELTFLVVQRRHHTRFFPMRPQDGDRSGNCKPGLVIDTDIVHPFEFDFYLQSHAGLLGTSRPAHYVVLMDENKFSADELQEFTYKLCHLQARCTRSVSVVPPAYYAHIVAARARLHSRNEVWTDSASSATGAGEESSYSAVKPELAKVMWFL
ncbi:Eukaryotic translation initiation factor 2C [Mortierella sp. NVP85]|nr:Eukaryotic translation initiation factor 2C [Mortierella sp. NVP85]